MEVPVRLLLLVLVVLASSLRAQLAGFDARVRQVMADWAIPGAAVAIIKDGKPLLVQGFGMRRLGERMPVGERTAFGIASLSKAFTAAALGLLVDEGRLAWDDPVVKHLPAFQLADPYVTRELTVRDLLCHRSGLGLGAGDLLLWGADYSREEVIPRLRYLRPASSFRSRYAYQNNMYVVAGYLVQAITGQTWEAFVEERFFQPLGMKATTTVRNRQGDIASPHSALSGSLRPIPYRVLDAAAPAGGINASVRDMVPWMQMLLGGGTFEGRRMLGERVMRELWQPQMLVPNRPPPPGLDPLASRSAAYGLGWDLRDYRGRRMVSHTGGLDGMTCMLGILPDDGIAVLVLTNSENTAWRALVLEAFDRLLGEPFFDWSAGFLNLQRQQEADIRDHLAGQDRTRAKETKPSRDLAAYAQDYRDAWYGEATIQAKGGSLELRLKRSPTFVGRLSHWHYDTFKVEWADPAAPAALLTFTLDASGRVEGFRMAPFSPAADFSYDYRDLDFRAFSPAR